MKGGIKRDNPAIKCRERLLELAEKYRVDTLQLSDNNYQTIRHIEAFAGVYYGMEHFCEMRGEILRTSRSLAIHGKRPLKCAVLGEFNAGKSSFINALVEKPDFLPVDVTPTTALISRIEHAPVPKVFLEMRDGSKKESSMAEFRCLVDENEDAAHRNEVSIVNVQVDYPALRTISIFDTPGLNSMYEAHTLITTAYISEADVILFVLRANQLAAGTELDTLRTIKNRGCKVYGIINKIDTILDGEDFCMDDPRWQKKVELSIEKARERCGFAIERFIPFSAKEALEGMKTGNSARIARSNIAELRQVIEGEIADRAASIRQDHLAAKASQYAGLANATQEYLQEIITPVKKGFAQLYKRLDLMEQEAQVFADGNY